MSAARAEVCEQRTHCYFNLNQECQKSELDSIECVVASANSVCVHVNHVISTDQSRRRWCVVIAECLNSFRTRTPVNPSTATALRVHARLLITPHIICNENRFAKRIINDSLQNIDQTLKLPETMNKTQENMLMNPSNE